MFICPYHQKTFILNFDTFNQLSRNINIKDGNFHVFIYPKDEKFFIGQPSKSNTTDITSHAVELENPIDKCSSSEDSDQRAEDTSQEQISNLENQTYYNPKSNDIEKKSSQSIPISQIRIMS